MKSIFNGQGYYMSDNRCSGGTHEEDDFLVCKHCQKGLRKSEWKLQGAFCHCCDAPICTECDKSPVCTPFMKKLETSVDEAYRREQNAKILGI